MSALVFAAPLALMALVALPALYFLLRLTPPPPRRLALPTLPLVSDILVEEKEPARTPLWLLLLRLLAAAALILAMAGPRWQPEASLIGAGNGPLLLMLDDGFASAPDWAARLEKAQNLLEEAQSRPVILLHASAETQGITPVPAQAALAKLKSLAPQPYAPPRAPMLAAGTQALAENTALSAIYISDGATVLAEQPLLTEFFRAAGQRLTLVAGEASLTGIMAMLQKADGVGARLMRLTSGGAEAGLLRALDEKGRLLGEARYAFAPGTLETEAQLTLPLDLVNAMTRLELAQNPHAGAVFLADTASRRRRVALVSGETTDTAQPLVSARYFVSRALEPYSELREPPRGAQNPMIRALEERPDVLVLLDIGTLAGETAEAVTRFVENGGMLIRFAGPGLAAAGDALLPVRLRRGGRSLGGALSWEKPQALAPFPEASPFYGLALRGDVSVERQVLAEPDGDIARASWAVLSDGTPLVTGARRGLGTIVLFHVTADTSWSNLPLSGVFVDMLRRSLQLAASRGVAAGDAARGEELRLPPRLMLDGFGRFTSPPASAQPLPLRFSGGASRAHPPGFYGPPEASLAVNALNPQTPLVAMDGSGPARAPLKAGEALDLRKPLMALAAFLLLLDALAVVWLAGFRLAPRRAKTALGLLLAIGFAGLLQPGPLHAQTPEDIRSSLKPRLAYVITGNAMVDEASRAGLYGLSQVLAQRTSIQLDEPIGVKPERDELVFYSLLYWPLIANQPNPPEGAIKAIDTFMKNGGTMLFDTRDAYVQRPGGQPTAETRALRSMLASLDIPALEPVPPDHVLTKTFYLLENFIGRYATGETWVEALVGARDARVPARAGDRVSPVIITSNDLAAAWATDRFGQPLYPMVPGEGRQREMALRTGINLVMYVMTGNYKSDQVHVPALLERLGQ